MHISSLQGSPVRKATPPVDLSIRLLKIDLTRVNKDSEITPSVPTGKSAQI